MTTITNVSNLKAQNEVKKVSKKIESTTKELSSGERVNFETSAADASKVIKLNSDASVTRQGIENANQGISMMQVAEGGLNEIGNILTRMKELATLNSSDTVSENEKQMGNLEFQQLKQEIERISSNTKYNGNNLLDGSAGAVSFVVGDPRNNDNNVVVDFSTVESSLRKLGLSGEDVADSNSSQSSISTLDESINQVNSYRSYLGAFNSRLQFSVNANQMYKINVEQAAAQVKDTDYAESTSNMVKQQIQNQAATSVLGQTQLLKNNIIKLLN